jgi:hypothetical protein
MGKGDLSIKPWCDIERPKSAPKFIEMQAQAR